MRHLFSILMLVACACTVQAQTVVVGNSPFDFEAGAANPSYDDLVEGSTDLLAFYEPSAISGATWSDFTTTYDATINGSPTTSTTDGVTLNGTTSQYITLPSALTTAMVADLSSDGGFIIEMVIATSQTARARLFGTLDASARFIQSVLNSDRTGGGFGTGAGYLEMDAGTSGVGSDKRSNAWADYDTGITDGSEHIITFVFRRYGEVSIWIDNGPETLTWVADTDDVLLGDLFSANGLTKAITLGAYNHTSGIISPFDGRIERVAIFKGVDEGALSATKNRHAAFLSSGSYSLPSAPISLTRQGEIADDASFATASLLSLRPYVIADFAELSDLSDAGWTYFWLYSTDHDAGDGELGWGVSTELDLSDYADGGVFWSPATSSQVETPFLYREAGDPNSRPLYIAYQAIVSVGNQATKLLSAASWNDPADGSPGPQSLTDEGTIIGVSTDRVHTGYLVTEDDGAGGWLGWHLMRGGGAGYFSRSTSSNGKSWTIGVQPVDGWTHAEGGYQSSFGSWHRLTLSSTQYWIGRYVPTSSTGGASSATGRIAIAAMDDDWVVDGPMHTLLVMQDDGSEHDDLRDSSVIRVGDTLYVYYITYDGASDWTVHLATADVTGL